MLKTVTLLFLTLFSLSVFAQEQLKHEKKTYTSPDGRFYVQKSLPVYIWMSTSESEGSVKYRLKSEVTTKYSNPMYFDTEGYNTVRSPSAVDTSTHKTIYPLRDIIFEVYADSRSPVTSIDFGEVMLYKSEGKINLGTGTRITLKAKDQLSGVENIYYSIDGAPYKPYSEPINIAQEKEYILKYYAVDNVGNVEEVHELTLVYDKTAPSSKLEIEGDKYENILSARSKIILTTEDQGAGSSKIVYSLDEGGEKVYTSPILAAYISQDDHILYYHAEDKVGNKEVKRSYNFYVDKTPPTIIEEIMGKSFFSGGKEFSSGKTRLKLTSFDNKAGVREVRYSVNNGEYEFYDNPVFLTQTSGNLVIKSYAVDNVNNRSNSQTANEKTSIPYIDLTGPELSHIYNGPKFITRDTTFISAKTKIILRGADSEAGMNRIEYSVDGSGPREYTDPVIISDEGYKVIDMTGFDNVDNTSANSFGVKVDASGPELSYSYGTSSLGKKEGKQVYPAHTVLFISATDNVVGFEKMTYSLNGGISKPYNGMIGNLPKGNNEIKIIALDQLGNSSELVVNFIIE
ncbi:MAG: chitobiase/beta-hexosaminidase C-terminal domain-containing protein [Bacteroidales bacterium]|nr:chitobiase/beta-hexosaminidase C-terminal domain-containing protein [Bacteroidales bacterium]